MRSTKQYGLVNSWQEHRMLVHAEHTYEKRHRKEEKEKHEMVGNISDSYVHGGKTSQSD